MQARISDIPVKEDATWGAVFALLMQDHRNDWRFHWREQGERKDSLSLIVIEAPGEDVGALRAEIEEAVGLVNEVVRRDPLKQMVEIDDGHVEVLVD
jgi:hypothetical protein